MSSDNESEDLFDMLGAGSKEKATVEVPVVHEKPTAATTAMEAPKLVKEHVPSTPPKRIQKPKKPKKSRDFLSLLREAEKDV